MKAHITVVTADLSPDQSSTWRRSHHISRTLPAGHRLAGTHLLPHPFSGSLPPLAPHPETSTIPNTCPWRWHISRGGAPPVTRSPGKLCVGSTSDRHALMLGGGAKGKVQCLNMVGAEEMFVEWCKSEVMGLRVCFAFLFFLWAVHIWGATWSVESLGFQSWFSLNLVSFPHWPSDSPLWPKVIRLSNPFMSLLTLLRFWAVW